MTTRQGTPAAGLDSDVDFDFDRPLVRAGLNTLKWEWEIEKTGQPDLLGFGTADLDFPSAPAISTALQELAARGHFGYPHKPASYYEAMIGFYDRHFGWKIEREWIAANVGIYPSMRPLIAQLSEPGDEVIYQPPVHFQFPAVIKAAGRVPLANPLVLRDGRYQMDFGQLEAVVTSRTKLFLLCSPHNPVGRVWTRAELERLSEFCTQRGIVVISDEVYCGLLFEGVTFTPFATVSSEAAMQSVILTSASKMFNLTGLKHSQVVAQNPGLMAAYVEGLKQDTLGYGGSIFGHVAHEIAYRDCDDWLQALMRHVAANYDFAEDFLTRTIPGIGISPRPESTYFMWLDFRSFGLDPKALRDLLEGQFGLSLNYGEDLGAGGEGHIRLNIGTQRSTLEAGLKRLHQALATLSR